MKKNRLIIVLFCCLCFGVTALSIGLNFSSADKMLDFIIPVDTNNCLSTGVYRDEEADYVFLPSCADIRKVTLDHSEYFTVYINGEKYNKSFCFCEGEYSLEIKLFQGISILKKQLILVKSEEVPSLFISLNNGTIEDIHKNIDEKKTGTATYVDSDTNLMFAGEFKTFSGRGNSSWEKEKKPYNLDFKNEVSLIDGVWAKEYCLLANAYEESNIRNKLVFDFSADLGLVASPKSDFVDLYIDGEYRGLFLLTEKISDLSVEINSLQEQTAELNQFSLKTYDEFQVAEPLLKTGYRIPNNPSDITGGYIVEVDPRYVNSDNVFAIKSDLHFSVYYPKYCSETQMDYVSSLFLDIESAIEDGDYFDLIDVESWAKYYLVQEFFGNIDVASYFFYKDSDATDSKVYAGPVWDFELSCGLGGYDYPEGKTVPNRFFVNNWGVYEKLFQNEEFRKELNRIYAEEFRALALTINDRAESYKQYIEKAATMNFLRWRNEQRCDWFAFSDLLSENIDYIKTFLNERLEYFDCVFIDNIPIVKITRVSDKQLQKTSFFYVVQGTKIDTAGCPTLDGYTFVGWYDENEKPLDITKPVLHDITLYAKWKDGATLNNSETTVDDSDLWTMIKARLHYVGYAALIFIVVVGFLSITKDIANKVKLLIRERKHEK